VGHTKTWRARGEGGRGIGIGIGIGLKLQCAVLQQEGRGRGRTSSAPRHDMHANTQGRLMKATAQIPEQRLNLSRS